VLKGIVSKVSIRGMINPEFVQDSFIDSFGTAERLLYAVVIGATSLGVLTYFPPNLTAIVR